jgi:hypothetical protein
MTKRPTYAIFLIDGYNITVNMFYNLCLNINYPFNDQIHVGSNKVYLDVTIHNSHTLMGTFAMC